MARSTVVALDRLPALATTGVGSLPFTDPATAARHAARAYELPFCPQLPALDGDMVGEWLGSDPRRCGWTVDRDRRRPAAWDAVRAELATRPPAHGLVKLQVTGPLTLARALGDLELAVEIAHWLAAGAAERARVLGELGLGVVLLVDEPGLAAVAGGAVAGVWGPLRAAGAAAWGLHVCGPVPWSLVTAAQPDVVSFDLARYGVADDARAALTAHMRRGGWIAWGALDPVAPDDTTVTAGRVAAAIASLGAPPALVAQRSLLTPSCGSGRLSPAGERLLAATLDVAARETRAAVRALTQTGDERRACYRMDSRS
jgi:hypothetical protein